MDLSKPQKFDTCRAQTLFLPIFVGRGCMQYLTRWARTASGTNWCNKYSILADKEFASHPMFTPRKQKEVTSENKEKHTK